MAKLILQTQVSIDGYMGSKDGDTSWLVWPWSEEWTWDADLRAYHEQLIASCGIVLLSGKMVTGGFLDHWRDVAAKENDPQQTFAQAIVNAEKASFSRADNRSLSAEVNALKKKSDLIAWGGSDFAQSLLREDLVDEIHLLVNPTAIGDGLPVFPAGEKPRTYRLRGAKTYPCGVTLMRYTS